MRKRTGLLCAILTIGLMSVGNTTSVALAVKPPNLEQSDLSYAIWVLVDAPRDDLAVQLARENNVRVYCQEPNREDAARARQTAERAGRLGSQIFIGEGPLDHLNLAGNVADAVMVFEPDNKTSKDEALRVLRPGRKAVLGQREDHQANSQGCRRLESPVPRAGQQSAFKRSTRSGTLSDAVPGGAALRIDTAVHGHFRGARLQGVRQRGVQRT